MLRVFENGALRIISGSKLDEVEDSTEDYII